MFWKKREERNQRTETDACRGCDLWDRSCAQVDIMTELLKTGMHLDVTFCPHLRPPLGGAHG
jgi:hypothetical protein